jgi:beta-lactamase superfamily II metal-dependent hydrolase
MAQGPLQIRMYDVGFGDCFLLHVPTGNGVRKILVDCGSIKAGATPFPRIVAQVIKDVTESDGVARIDVVIATHRHRDHISGFEDEAWSSVQVGEVWLPWTENEDDPDAVAIRDHQIALAQRLERALSFLPADNGLTDLTLNALGNEQAMQTLREGFVAHPAHGPTVRRHYLPDSNLSRTLASDALPGISVSVLGPSRDARDIRYLEPREDDDHYLRLAGEDLPAVTGQDGRLFPSDWTVDTPAVEVTQEERERLRTMGTGNEAALASWLDGALNNTSLMIVLKVGKAHLLLPGDSQWGSWMRVLDDPTWRSLLKRTGVYKVGHHGSYNATPRPFVEECLQENALSLVSVIPHGSYKRVPKDELLEALGTAHRRVIRSDKAAEGPSVFKRKIRPGISVEFAIAIS